MNQRITAIILFIRRLLSFGGRVFIAFLRNRGILLAGGVGYNALLSAVPFFALTVTGLSFFFDERKLMSTISAELELLMPNQTSPIIEVIETFLDSREVFGIIGFTILIFFSSIAFRMLEEAISSIFEGERPAKRRRWWVSVLLPYMFIFVLGIALLMISLLQGVLKSLSSRSIQIVGYELSLASTSITILRFTSFLSLMFLFSGIYKILPVMRVSMRRALTGGFVAAILWTLLGQILAYYFANISLVNVIYGSLATVIVILLTMEAASIIVLLGAQVIAELERSANANLPWYQKAES